MNLHILFFTALASFAFLQWWALPQVEAAWAANRTVAKLARAGLVALFKAVRTVLQIAVLVYGLLLTTIWLLDIAGHPASASSLHSEIEYLETLKEPLTYIKEHVAAKIALAVALFGLAYLMHRRHRADLLAKVGSRVESEIDASERNWTVENGRIASERRHD